MNEFRQELVSEGERKDVDLTSFNFLVNTRTTIPSYINILEISRDFTSFVDKEPDFKSQLHLVRGSPNYSLFVKPASGAMGKRYSVTSLEFLKPGKKKKSLYAEFVGRIMIHVQFKHPEHFEFFKKILSEFIRLNHERNTPFGKFKYTHVPSQVCEYRVKKKKLGSPDRIMRQFLSGGGGGNSVGGGREFYEISAGEWDIEHLSVWLDHVLLQPTTEGERGVVTVQEYMKTKKLWDEFISYFESDNGTTETLLYEIRKFQEDRSQVNPKLIKVFHDRHLLRSIRLECQDLKKRNGMFNIYFALVLRKRVRYLERSLHKGSVQLSGIVYNLKHERRYWWSVEDCRDYILSFLLFRKEFDKFVEEMEELFFEKERQKFEPIIGVDWEDDLQPLLIPSNDWDVFLEEFNEENFGGGNKWLEVMSYRVHVAVQQNKLRRNREEYLEVYLESSEEVKDLERKLANTKLFTLKSRIDKLEKKVSDLKESNEEVQGRVMVRMVKILETEKLKLEQVEKERVEIQRLIGVKKSEEVHRFTHSDPKMQNLDREIYQMTLESISLDDEDEKYVFMDSRLRREKITEYLSKKIENIAGGDEGTKEFTVKLILSVLRGHVPPKWQRKLLSTLDKFWKPQFCKWGLVHMGVQISNVGFNWLSNGLVMISNLSMGRQYEELLAVDCNCPLLINVNTIYERITRLAEDVVWANVNKGYTLLNYWGKEGKLNCHEFAIRMITALNYTDFFPVLDSYITSMREDLTKITKGHNSLNLRYLDMNTIFPKSIAKQFKKEFGDVVEMMRKRVSGFMNQVAERTKLIEQEWKQEGGIRPVELDNFEKARTFNENHHKNRIFFNTHEDVDEFYSECLKIDNSFELNYPGVYQLLKAFDRSFWMRKGTLDQQVEDEEEEEEEEEEKSIWEEEILKPGNRGCPFIKQTIFLN